MLDTDSNNSKVRQLLHEGLAQNMNVLKQGLDKLLSEVDGKGCNGDVQLNDKDIEYRWGVAETYYPDLSDLRRRLSLLSDDTSDKFLKKIVKTKSFESRHKLAKDLEAEFFDDLCASNCKLIIYGKSLLDSEAMDEFKMFVETCEILGGKVAPDLLAEHIVESFPRPFHAGKIKFLEIFGSSSPKDIYTEKSQFVKIFGPSRPRTIEVEPMSLPKKQIPRVDQDIASRLRSTFIGYIYINCLNRYVFVRQVALWFWKRAFPLYIKYFFLPSRKELERWYPLTKLSDFIKKKEIPAFKLADTAVVETSTPTVYPVRDQRRLVPLHSQYIFPKVFVSIISNVTAYGGSNLTLTDNEVICHDLYDFDRDYTSEELHGRTQIDSSSRRIQWLLHDDSPELIPVAATFIDAVACNYAHWLTEVLPRIILFCAEDRFKNVPIVVNEGLHQNIMESLFLVAGAERKIITLPIGRALIIESLYLTSVAGYVPFERRKNKLRSHSHGLFSPQAFEMLRAHLVVNRQIPKKTWPEKIFIRRNSSVRKITNADDLEKLLISKGYVIIEPEKLTFLHQALLFSNAKTIVGSSGAALANILFASQSAKIFILISKHPETSHWYWQNIACASGKTVHYVFGKIAGFYARNIHSDFTIDLKDLLLALREGT